MLILYIIENKIKILNKIYIFLLLCFFSKFGHIASFRNCNLIVMTLLLFVYTKKKRSWAFIEKQEKKWNYWKRKIRKKHVPKTVYCPFCLWCRLQWLLIKKSLSTGYWITVLSCKSRWGYSVTTRVVWFIKQ